MQYPDFVDNTQFIQMDTSVSDTEQLQAMLNNLTRVHKLTAGKFDSFDALIHEYLSCGCEIFDLETGIVSRIDSSDRYYVLDVISPLEALEKGQQFELKDTYCREVVNTQSVMGFPQVGSLDFMKSHPVYTNLKLEAYLSSPIYVDDKLFGTLNFTSTNSRPHGFSKNEYDLILLMANAIGNYILLRNKNDRLKELNSQLMQFVGFVAHDLRNPIGGIAGLAELAQLEIDNKDELAVLLPKITQVAEDSLELINSILDMAALSTGKLEADIKVSDTGQILQDSIASVSAFANQNEISFNVQAVESRQVLCDIKRIQQAIVNLLINAIKYSPKNSEITLKLAPEGENSILSVTNTISHNNAVNRSETGLYESVGFGLDIVKTILKAHDTELLLEVNESFFKASFTLSGLN